MRFYKLVKLLSVLCVITFLQGPRLFAQARFIPNGGQWNSEVKYRAELVNGHLWITAKGLLFNQWDAETSVKAHYNYLGRDTLKGHAYRLEFIGGNFDHITATGVASEEYYNFFLGSDPSKWATGLHANTQLTVKDLYPGVDLIIYSTADRLKYDLLCHNPQAWTQIKLRYNGVDSVALNRNTLEVFTSINKFSDVLPYIKGISNSGETEIKGNYVLENGVVRFSLQGELKKFKQIVIDPILVFSTFTGSRADNFGCTGTYDEKGNAFSGGTVFGNGYPSSLGAYQTFFGGGQSEGFGYGGPRDVAVIKYTPNGQQMIFATYLGGENNEQPHSMVCDSTGNLYIMGSTRSGFFPVTAGAYQPVNRGDYDFFISKLSPDGKTLLASTQVGGDGLSNSLDCVGANRGVRDLDECKLIYNYADEFRGEIICDRNYVYIAGSSYSQKFPSGSLLDFNHGEQDGVVMCMSNDLTTMKWSRLIGGNDFDAFYGLAIGKNNELFVSGGTSSSNLKILYPSFANSYLGGIADGFIMRFDINNGTVLGGRHLGTADYDQSYFVQTDNSGNPYIFGVTEGSVPRINANFNQANKGQFIQRFDPSLTTITLSTTFGSIDNKPNLSPSAFLVDKCERIFVSGWGGGTNDHLPKTHHNTGSTFGMSVTPDAYQKKTDGSDFYVAVFSRGMYDLLYATFFGGLSTGGIDAEEHVDGGTSRFDKKGVIYQSICGGCGRNGLFPTTPKAYSRTMNSNNCNNAMFKLDFENLNHKPQLKDTFIQVVATQPINFNLYGTDGDHTDTLFFITDWLNRSGLPANDTPSFSISDKFGNKGFGIGSVTLNVKWDTRCRSWANDTLKLRIRLFDHGCPKADTSTIIIKILVTRPPIVVPPDAICVSYDRPSGKLRIDWPSTVQDASFYKYMLLIRQNPDGQLLVLDTIKVYNKAGFYLDQPPTDPYAANYCYYLLGRNTCDEDSVPRGRFCTVTELNTPINTTKVRFVTVENDRTVKINWFKSDEQDFKQYEVYRYKPAEIPNTRKAFYYTTDTQFYDSSFDVDHENYCYSIIVTDKCGHISNHSNKGCNVIIAGSATGRPWYFFDLNWQRYYDWNNGIMQWKLERKYGTKNWETITTTDSATRIYRDNKLDYDWGGYQYRVTATENPGNSALPAQSQSNWIYLYQPPELWVPNAFTDNLDNLNDIWGIVPVFVKDYHMMVFNRWGQKVWETQNKKDQWNGMVNGKQPADAVFAWYVIFTGWDNKTYQMKGTVTVIH